MLVGRIDELLKHTSTLMEPSISNIAAGTFVVIEFELIKLTSISSLFAVSSAVRLLGDDLRSGEDWLLAIETIYIILSNILKNPGNEKYYRLNLSNENFHRR
jgi:hypothetical protein